MSGKDEIAARLGILSRHLESLPPPVGPGPFDLLAVDQAQASQLSGYLDLLERWTAKVDLVAPASRLELIERHVVDCAAAAALLLPRAPTGPIFDIGSGAGLPGLIWAIQQPARELVLVEPRQKRVSFLKEARRALGLNNCRIENCRLQDLAAREPLEGLIVARALGQHRDFITSAAGILLPGGQAALMQGPAWNSRGLELITAEGGSNSLRLVHTLQYSLGEDGPQRCLPIWTCEPL